MMARHSNTIYSQLPATLHTKFCANSSLSLPAVVSMQCGSSYRFEMVIMMKVDNYSAISMIEIIINGVKTKSALKREL